MQSLDQVLFKLKKSIIENDIDESEILNQNDTQLAFYILQLFQSIDAMRQRLQQQLSEQLNNDYESLIQSLEAQVRKHIRTQYQQNLQIELLNNKIEEITREKENVVNCLEEKIKQLQNQLTDNNQYNNFFHHQLDLTTQKKTPSAFEKMHKLMSNKSQQNLHYEDRSLSQRKTSIPIRKTATINNNKRQICFQKSRLQQSIVKQDYSHTQREEVTDQQRRTKKIILQLKGSIPQNFHLSRSGLQF